MFKLPENPYSEYEHDLGCKQQSAYNIACQDTLKDVIDWLFKPCAEHYSVFKSVLFQQHEISEGKFCMLHRYECPQCMQELKEC